MARPGSGMRTEAASTNAIEPPVPGSEAVPAPSWRVPLRSAARTRASRTAPRKTLSNVDRHASSPAVAMVPAGGPPTLISAPSRRPKRSRAALISWPGAAGLALSATIQAAVPDAASWPMRAAFAAMIDWLANFFIIEVFPVTQNAISLSGVLVVFASLALLAIVFVWKFLPETKGLPVEDIVKIFERQQQAGPLGGSSDTAAPVGG